MKRANWKLYRWWIGGSWAYIEGAWHPVRKDGYVVGPCLNSQGNPSYFMCHRRFVGIEQLENY